MLSLAAVPATLSVVWCEADIATPPAVNEILTADESWSSWVSP